MLQEILNTILTAAITAAGSALVGFIIYGIKKFTSWLSTKTKNAKIQALLSSADSLADMVVEEVYQTYVEGLKNKNKFDAKAQSEALNMAKNKIQTLMSTEVKDCITSAYSDLGEWITSKIESTIYSRKNNGIILEADE